MSIDIKAIIKRAADVAMNGPVTADMQDSDDAKAVAFHISSRIMGLGDELPRTDTGNPVSPSGHVSATSGCLWGGETPPQNLDGTANQGGRETLPPFQADSSTQGGNDSVPPAPADAPVSASNEGGDQTISPLVDVAARSLVDKSGPECRNGFTGSLVDKAPDLQGKLVDESAKTQGFDEWLVRDYGGMFDPIGEEEADTISRIVKAVASSAWQGARKAALQQVSAELERRYQEAWQAWKVRFEGAHAEGQVDALDAVDGWVTSLLEQKP